MASKLDLLRLFEQYDCEVELGDFTPDEIQELLEKMHSDGAARPLTKEQFKQRYFEFYDDVKDKSLKRQDW